MFETIEDAPPGPELLAVLDGLDAQSVDRGTCLDAIAGYERVAAAITARTHELTATLDATRHPDPRKDFTPEELAGVLGIAPETAEGRLDNSARIYGRLKATWWLLRTGQLSGLHAKLLADAIAPLADDQCGLVEAYVLRDADHPTYRAWRRRISYALKKYAPVDADRACQRDREARGVWHEPGGNETGMLTILGPLNATMIAWCMIDDLAHSQPADDRTVDQRRFDAFTALFLGEKAWDRITPHIEVTVPLDTLQGRNTPGDLAGYGPISADTARELANQTHARWRRLVYAPDSGHLVALGDKTYRPDQVAKLLSDPVEAPPKAEDQYRASAKLRRWVQARWRYCPTPGCGHRARHAHLDHTKKYREGGATSRENFRPYCPRHHRAKDVEGTGWTSTANTDGSTTITDPTYRTWPHDYRGP
ncbi:MAG: DUF222 domain-containing protein [Actinoallomurus sp.]